MEPRLIKKEEDHKAFLAEVERLVALDPAPNTPEGDRLELLATLVENYEKKHFPIGKPTPIEAILFRMEQQGLKQKDLVPYLGSKSKVSEVLAGKRPLTLSMVRSLHEGLKIPLDILVNGANYEDDETSETDWARFPIREMIKRNWISVNFAEAQKRVKEILQQFLAPLEGENLEAILLRRTLHERSDKKMDRYALLSWVARVRGLATKINPPIKYIPGTVTKSFLEEIARLSWSEKGPLIAQEYLFKHGIILMVEPHLPHTYLDGAAIPSKNGPPIIGVTIRHDRLDNFWHTLLHELAHVGFHFTDTKDLYVDDFDAGDGGNTKEIEADRLAKDSFVPQDKWQGSDAYHEQSEEAIISLAREMKIHPAIVAGRLRYETRNYRKFSRLVGNRQVRKLFPSVSWPEFSNG